MIWFIWCVFFFDQEKIDIFVNFKRLNSFACTCGHNRNTKWFSNYLEYHVAGIVHPKIFRSVAWFAQLNCQTVLQYQSASLRGARWFRAHLDILIEWYKQFSWLWLEFAATLAVTLNKMMVLTGLTLFLSRNVYSVWDTFKHAVRWLVYIFSCSVEMCDMWMFSRWFHCHHWNKSRNRKIKIKIIHTQILAFSK